MKLDCSMLEGDLARLPLVRSCDVVRSGALRVSTPFTYPNGEHIDVFVSTDLSGELFLSDHGQTFGYLADSGLRPWATKRRQEHLREITETLEVALVGDRLQCRLDGARLDEFPEALTRLAQACIRTADLLFTARSAAMTTMRERFEEFLSDTALQYEPDVELEGPYNVIRVDFRVRAGRLPSLVNTLSAGNPASASNAARSLFTKVHDLQQAGYGRDHQLLTILDSEARGFAPGDVERLEPYSTVLSFPENAEDIRRALAA